MAFPIVHLVFEDRTSQRVEPDAAVEGAHQPFDHRFVNAGPRDDLGDDQIAAWQGGLHVWAHPFPGLGAETTMAGLP
jgi:hypothetical protein